MHVTPKVTHIKDICQHRAKHILCTSVIGNSDIQKVVLLMGKIGSVPSVNELDCNGAMSGTAENVGTGMVATYSHCALKKSDHLFELSLDRKLGLLPVQVSNAFDLFHQ